MLGHAAALGDALGGVVLGEQAAAGQGQRQATAQPDAEEISTAEVVATIVAHGVPPERARTA